MKRIYEVGTFLHPRKGRQLQLSHVAAYIRWYSPQWDGCVVYRIEASTGEQAKDKARLMRLRDERTKEER